MHENKSKFLGGRFQPIEKWWGQGVGYFINNYQKNKWEEWLVDLVSGLINTTSKGTTLLWRYRSEFCTDLVTVVYVSDYDWIWIEVGNLA